MKPNSILSVVLSSVDDAVLFVQGCVFLSGSAQLQVQTPVGSSGDSDIQIVQTGCVVFTDQASPNASLVVGTCSMDVVPKYVPTSGILVHSVQCSDSFQVANLHSLALVALYHVIRHSPL